MDKRLRSLVGSIPGASAHGLPDVEIAAITDDSRRVTPGALFVAIRGETADGHDFVGQALSRGAVAVVGSQPLDVPGPYLRVDDGRMALAHLAAAWYDHPAQQLVMIGVTGTDGKTTTANLIHRILTQAELATGMITSVHARIGEETLDTGFHVTTPPALEVQGYLRRMVEAGLTHCVIEATSHGLEQRRLAACEFDLGVVTNITHEHLDYHGSAEAYRRAKAELFRGLDRSDRKAFGPPKTAVLNRDDDSYEYLRGQTEARILSYGTGETGDIRIGPVESDPDGIRFEVVGPKARQAIASPLLGEYNAINCLAAFAVTVEGLGVQPTVAAEGIRSLARIPGRMERIEAGQDFAAIVDFAHTPNALRRALHSARRLTGGRIIAVFGSAGLRDRAKRRMMAEVAAQKADITVLTAEDPRTEPLEDILEEMAAAAVAAGATEGSTLFRVPDRGQALRKAVSLAAKGDLVLACGKGHEQSMCFGEVEHPWDDRTALRAALAEHLHQPGPPMPWLPTSPVTG